MNLILMRFELFYLLTTFVNKGIINSRKRILFLEISLKIKGDNR